MKNKLVRLLVAALVFWSAQPSVHAQTNSFQVLHEFSPLVSGAFTNADGDEPGGSLIVSGNTLYGTCEGGGSGGGGAVFRVNTNGSAFTNLYSFEPYGPGTNNSGTSPIGGLVLSGNTLYGTASEGGTDGYGNLFRLNTDGSAFTNLHNFTGSDGVYPNGGLICSGNTLYGTTGGGGSAGNGTVFKINTDGSGYLVVHSFSSKVSATNSDGADPLAGLVLSGNTLFGTTYGGGAEGYGTVFRVNTDSSSFTNLHSFTAYNSSTFTNVDGAEPYYGTLAMSGNTLYGMTQIGGSGGNGGVFRLNTDGSAFTNLYSFTPTVSGINSDGADAYGGIVLSGNTLVGTTTEGGTGGQGTVFMLNTDGSGFATLHNFTALSGNRTNTDGAQPYASVVVSGNTAFGTAYTGGNSADGTVFSVAVPLPPALAIAATGNQVSVFWPASGVTYVLQTTTNLSSPNWVGVSNATPIVGYTVTNVPSGAFFRLQPQ